MANPFSIAGLARAFVVQARTFFLCQAVQSVCGLRWWLSRRLFQCAALCQSAVRRAERQLLRFIEQWNRMATQLAWTQHSFDQALAKVERSLPDEQRPLAARALEWSLV